MGTIHQIKSLSTYILKIHRLQFISHFKCLMHIIFFVDLYHHVNCVDNALIQYYDILNFKTTKTLSRFTLIFYTSHASRVVLIYMTMWIE